MKAAMWKWKHRFVVYLILCEDDRFYVGMTGNYHLRKDQHFAGEGALFTKRHKPKKFKILFRGLTEEEALVKEREFTAVLNKHGWRAYSA
jgi:predicted GIY-YIG superfamily endonuclease